MSAERYTPERLMAWADRATQFNERDVMRRLAEAWEREIKRLRAERDRLREALHFIDGPCENYTRGRCWDSGRVKGAYYEADAWCYPCIAREALAATDVQEAKPDE